MVDPELFSESEEVERLIRELEDVSKLSPREVFSYLVELSEVTLTLYTLIRDSLPRGYGRVKFSRFVEKKRRQVENMRHLAVEVYPDVAPVRHPKPSLNISIETVRDYVLALKNAIFLESLGLRAFRYLERATEDKLMFADLSEEIEENIRELREELRRAESFESRLRFSEFVKELVGDDDG